MDNKVAEIEAYFNERAAKQEQETLLLKKTLLQQTMNRINHLAQNESQDTDQINESVGDQN